jgi:hypothetical protein
MPFLTGCVRVMVMAAGLSQGVALPQSLPAGDEGGSARKPRPEADDRIVARHATRGRLLRGGEA